MSWHGRFRFGIKPEQLAKNQEHTKQLEAEGRRLDGSKPVKTWKELHEENILLSKKVESLEDEIFETMGKYTEMHEVANKLCAQLEELRTEYDTARTALRCFMKVFEVKEQETTVEMTEAEKAKAKKSEYNRRYYEKHKADILAKRTECTKAAKRAEYSRRYYQEHKAEIRAKQNAYMREYRKRIKEAMGNAGRMQ